MSTDTIPSIILNNVLIQENGWIRDENGHIIGRLTDRETIETVKERLDAEAEKRFADSPVIKEYAHAQSRCLDFISCLFEDVFGYVFEKDDESSTFVQTVTHRIRAGDSPVKLECIPDQKFSLSIGATAPGENQIHIDLPVALKVDEVKENDGVN